jgi:hypothetical protein
VSALKAGDRVRADDLGRSITGTVVRGPRRDPEAMPCVFVMWDDEEYDAGSLGHEIPSDLLHLLEAVVGRAPLRHRLHIMARGGE